MAKFFKSAYFKCAVTLLAIILLSGISISILSDVLYVSSEERTGRALQKIYGRALSSSEYHVVLDSENGDKAESYAFGEIEKIFRVGDENAKHDMIFKTTGKEGYKGGTVTLWIKVIVDGAHVGYVKAGSCAHLLKVIRESRIKKISCEMFGGPYKYIEEEYDYDRDKEVYTLDKGTVPYAVHLTIDEE